LLDSLRAQTYKNFQVLIVDQNADDRIKGVIASAGQGLDICYLSSDRGLSRARNVALRFVDGDVIAFPDDDCWYPPNLLERVAAIFSANPDLGGLTAKLVDENGNAMKRRRRRRGELNRISVFSGFTSVTIFIRKSVVEAVGEFDETLGVASSHGLESGEETDYLIRAMEIGFRIRYFPELYVHHPPFVKDFSPAAIAKAFVYSRGYGFVLGKHKYPAWYVIYIAARPLVGAVVQAIRLRFARCNYHFNIFAGRISGWLYARSLSSDT
jgi:glycosyltransferase involved in cell wall biosynthesis